MGARNGVLDLKMDLIAPYKDPLARVLREAMEIQELENKEIGWTSVEQDGRKAQCMNSKQEYYQNVIPRNIQIRGNLHEVKICVNSKSINYLLDYALFLL